MTKVKFFKILLKRSEELIVPIELWDLGKFFKINIPQQPKYYISDGSDNSEWDTISKDLTIYWTNETYKDSVTTVGTI
jgi:hypothetical protein